MLLKEKLTVGQAAFLRWAISRLVQSLGEKTVTFLCAKAEKAKDPVSWHVLPMHPCDKCNDG